MIRVLVLVLLVACEVPPLTIIYRISDGPTQSCPSASCEEVGVACESVLDIRILRPTAPMQPLIDVCEGVNPDRDGTLCAIDTIDLPRKKLPAETLEVQVVLWPRSVVEDPETGELDCKTHRLTFSLTDGFPLDQIPAPALGGHSYFEPGDERTEVLLGCTDLMSVNQDTCIGKKRVAVTATVFDFDVRKSVSESLGNQLAIDIGEPKEEEGRYVMDPGDVTPLARTVAGPDPVWGGDVEQEFQTSACLQVLEDVPQATSSITCRDAKPTNEMIDITGFRMSKATVQQIVSALALPAFPEEGMTIGIVVDYQDNPVAGQVVVPDNGTIQYINAARTGTVPGQTSASGIFVSRDAPYRTRFTTAITGQTVVGIGGRVEGKVTIVVLQFPELIGSKPRR
ncbi:MAG TPA: hypothetical protein VIU61_12805 [Kofleriaceae bacterium]